MAIKYYCDGCDDEIGPNARFDKRTRRQISIDWSEARGSVPYDLCDACLNKADPKNWPRAAKDMLRSAM